MQKQTDTRAHDCSQSSDLWHQPMLASVTCPWSWRLYGISPALASSCLSSYISAVPTERISDKFCIGNCYENLLGNPQIWLKSVKNYGQFTRRAKNVWTVGSSIKYFVAWQHCKRYSLFRFHGNTKPFCIVDSYLYIKNTVGRICCASMPIMVLRERFIVTLCVHCLSCFVLRLTVVCTLYCLR